MRRNLRKLLESSSESVRVERLMTSEKWYIMFSISVDLRGFQSVLDSRLIVSKSLITVMPYCAAINCSNDSTANVSFFRFPLRNKKLLERWLIVMRRNSSEEKKSKRWQPTESSRICSVHFSEDCFTQDLKALRSLSWPIKRLTLKPDAVPSIFDFSRQSASGSSKRKRTEEAIHKHHRTPEKKERAANEKRRRREVILS